MYPRKLQGTISKSLNELSQLKRFEKLVIMDKINTRELYTTWKVNFRNLFEGTLEMLQQYTDASLK